MNDLEPYTAGDRQGEPTWQAGSGSARAQAIAVAGKATPTARAAETPGAGGVCISSDESETTPRSNRERAAMGRMLIDVDARSLL